MKKQLLYLVTLAVIASQIGITAQAAKRSTVPTVATLVRKYKAGNYTGCLQDSKNLVYHDPSNAVAYYYMAISYVQAGKSKEAIDAYKKVLSLKPNATLYKYATTGKTCLESPDKCKEDNMTDVDRAVRAPLGDGLSDKVRDDIEQKRLEGIKNDINNGLEINNYELQKFKDYSNSRSEAQTPDKVAQESNAQPTNDEIVAALKTLNRAGLNPYTQTAAVAQNPEYAQLSAMMGGNNQSSNSNAMMNMLPYMLAQNKAGGANSYSPQMMQAMMMSSMLPDFDLDTNKDK